MTRVEIEEMINIDSVLVFFLPGFLHGDVMTTALEKRRSSYPKVLYCSLSSVQDTQVELGFWLSLGDLATYYPPDHATHARQLNIVVTQNSASQRIH